MSEIALQNRFRYDSYSIEYTESNMFDSSGNRYEGTRGYEEEHHWDCDGSLTYKLSYREGGQFETGYQYTTYSELLLAAEKSPDIDTAEIYLKAAITYIQENGLLNGYDLEIKEGTFPLYQKGSNNINAWWKELNDDLADIQLARENLMTGNDSGILPSDVMKNLITPAYINPPRL